jgi:hypothetical protein
MEKLTVSEAASRLEEARSEWMKGDSYSVHSIDSVSFDDNRVYVDQVALNNIAIPKMLYRMQLTEGFIDYKDQVERGDFKAVFDSIIKWNRGKQIVTRKSHNEISDVFFYNGNEQFDSNLRLGLIIDGVQERVSKMTDEIEIHGLNIDTVGKSIKFSTVDPKTRFSAIGNDDWVLGSILRIALTDAFASPYYGRLVCTNGMVDGIKMRKTSLSGKGYTQAAIAGMINKGTNLKKLASDHIKEISHSAVNCQVSLSEYLSLRSTMVKGLDERQSDVADLVFPLGHIIDAYGEDALAKDNQWKSTAKAGCTVYEMLNDITKWTTHDNTVSNQTMKNVLNEKASKWFIKGAWDNRNVAPDVELRRKPVFEDSIALV